MLDHDFGFAPNPFYGVCTLATCKPKIREHAAVGDFVVGTGSAKRGRRGYLVYFMAVDEILTYDQYWADPRFLQKRPNRRGSKMQAFGDNIYHTARTGGWAQADSFHSLRTGRANPLNVEHDTKSAKVLIGHEYAYWGGTGPEIPAIFRQYDGVDLCAGRGHKNRFDDEMVFSVLSWLVSLDERGYAGTPTDWKRSR